MFSLGFKQFPQPSLAKRFAGINLFLDILLSLLVWDSTDSKSLSHRVIHCSELTLAPTKLIPLCR